MSMDLTGIINRNEYYTNHYFAAIFAENAKETVSDWRTRSRESDYQTPWSRLREAGRRYYILRDQYQRGTAAKPKAEIIEELAQELLGALDYPLSRNVEYVEIQEELEIPVHLEMKRPNETPLLWAILVNGAGEEGELLNRTIDSLYVDQTKDDLELTNEELISRIFFALDEPPRWVLLIGIDQVVLLDRSKWNEKRYLLFELDDIFGRREETTLQAMSVLLHQESLCPTDGISLLDQLDENSHRHASSVSEDLKYALRECIELLGNEVIYDKRTRLREGVFNKQLADELTVECLRYMYRILFILFIEARPELEYAPINSPTYMKGYSFESLRDIVANIKDDETEVADGYFLHESLSMLFEIIYDGYPPERSSFILQKDEESHQNVFIMEPLKAHIFDLEYTPHLSRAKLRNGVLAQIIDLMSVSRGGRGRQRRGRISYAALGINQLGAVYEALLSYRGFFAEERLYEVKRARDSFNELDVGYFVPERELDNYTEEERVRYTEGPNEGKLRIYEKGTFIYRLAGREREKSASYYTPEVLTQCLVKYALKELLEGKTADEILNLTICEPAMGSAAFLNEAINQLAEAYLILKQKETGETISHEDWLQELQRTKMYIADRNVYGIDLNPIAVELGEVSLWLNTIYKGAHVPWFGTQLVCGNSLIGARRQVYDTKRVTTKTANQLWFKAAPKRIPTDEKRDPENEIYHFLLGDPGMANYTDRVIRSLEPEAIETLKEWNKQFTKSLEKEELETILRLSTIVDDLWERQIQLRKEVAKQTRDPLTVFGQPENGIYGSTSIREKDSIYRHLYKSEEMENAGPYARLKFAMDYWCALWFWPIDKAHLLPSRKEFLFDMSLILEGGVVSVQAEAQQKLFDDAVYIEIIETYGDHNEVNLDALRKNSPRLKLAKDIADRHRFLHWELEFADLFAERGGFDLILGNPPWILLGWNEKGVLSDSEPRLVIKNFTATQTARVRDEVLKDGAVRDLFVAEFEEMSSTQNYLKAVQNYPDLVGMKVNLFKCFLPQAWMIGNPQAVASFIHPEGVYNDPRGGLLRKSLYPRLRKYFQFHNELKYFPIGNRERFALNVYCNEPSDGFEMIANLIEVSTVDRCYANDGIGEVPGIKDNLGRWNIMGRFERIVPIGKQERALFARLLDDSEDASQARVPAMHEKKLIEVLECFDNAEQTISSLSESIFSSQMWNETNAQDDGTILRDVRFGESLSDLIYSGPHVGVANPLFKTSRRICDTHRAFDNIDLTNVSDNYMQRVNYSPVCSIEEYLRRVPVTPWGAKYTSDYRFIARRMLNLSGERTLIGAIVPPATGHINLLYGFIFKNLRLLTVFAGSCASIVFDFVIKVMGKEDLYFDNAGKLPLLDDTHVADYIVHRYLLLGCLTRHYQQLWQRVYDDAMNLDTWAKSDPRLRPERFSTLNSTWTWDTPLRTDYERRQALVELDVLVAMGLGMTLEQLKTIYRIQFPVLKQYEQDTWYDRNGRIVFTNNRSLTGVGYSRPEFNEIRDATRGTFSRTITDDTQPGGPVERTIEYVAPFDRCDREQDYDTVWHYFENKFSTS